MTHRVKSSPGHPSQLTARFSHSVPFPRPVYGDRGNNDILEQARRVHRLMLPGAGGIQSLLHEHDEDDDDDGDYPIEEVEGDDDEIDYSDRTLLLQYVNRC